MHKSDHGESWWNYIRAYAPDKLMPNRDMLSPVYREMAKVISLQQHKGKWSQGKKMEARGEPTKKRNILFCKNQNKVKHLSKEKKAQRERK